MFVIVYKQRDCCALVNGSQSFGIIILVYSSLPVHLLPYLFIYSSVLVSFDIYKSLYVYIYLLTYHFLNSYDYCSNFGT